MEKINDYTTLFICACKTGNIEVVLFLYDSLVNSNNIDKVNIS